MKEKERQPNRKWAKELNRPFPESIFSVKKGQRIAQPQ